MYHQRVKFKINKVSCISGMWPPVSISAISRFINKPLEMVSKDYSKTSWLETRIQLNIDITINKWTLWLTDNYSVIFQSKKLQSLTEFSEPSKTVSSPRDGKNPHLSSAGDIFKWELFGLLVQESLYMVSSSRSTISSGLLLVISHFGATCSTTGPGNQLKKSKTLIDIF